MVKKEKHITQPIQQRQEEEFFSVHEEIVEQRRIEELSSLELPSSPQLRYPCRQYPYPDPDPSSPSSPRQQQQQQQRTTFPAPLLPTSLSHPNLSPSVPTEGWDNLKMEAMLWTCLFAPFSFISITFSLHLESSLLILFSFWNGFSFLLLIPLLSFLFFEFSSSSTPSSDSPPSSSSTPNFSSSGEQQTEQQNSEIFSSSSCFQFIFSSPEQFRVCLIHSSLFWSFLSFFLYAYWLSYGDFFESVVYYILAFYYFLVLGCFLVKFVRDLLEIWETIQDELKIVFVRIFAFYLILLLGIFFFCLLFLFWSRSLSQFFYFSLYLFFFLSFSCFFFWDFFVWFFSSMSLDSSSTDELSSSSSSSSPTTNSTEVHLPSSPPESPSSVDEEGSFGDSKKELFSGAASLLFLVTQLVVLNSLGPELQKAAADAPNLISAFGQVGFVLMIVVGFGMSLVIFISAVFQIPSYHSEEES